MEAIQERGGHTYLVDGTKLLAYIKFGTSQAEYFEHPLRFDRRGRKFDKVDSNSFKSKPKTEMNNIKEVLGSKGAVYLVNIDQRTCSCPGFTYRGNCKHVAEIG